MDLPKHPVVHGHPIHAILSDGPVVLIPLAIAAEAWDRREPVNGIRLGDVVTACAAAATLAAGFVGWIDWLTVPPDHPVRRPATIHGIINSTALLALAGAVPTRRRRWRVRPAEEAEIVEQRLDDPAAAAAFADARREVADFERQKTFLPAS